MIAAELRGGSKPSLTEALGWIGSRVDDIYGTGVGRLEDVWIDPGTGAPRWLLVKEGRFGGRTTLIPFEDATAGAGHVWIPYERDVVREAPAVEAGAPLTQQVEAALRRHYASNTAAAAVPHGDQDSPVATSAAAALDREGTHARSTAPHAPAYQHHEGMGSSPHPGQVEAGSPGALSVPAPQAPQRQHPAPRNTPPPMRPPAPPPRPHAAHQARPHASPGVASAAPSPAYAQHHPAAQPPQHPAPPPAAVQQPTAQPYASPAPPPQVQPESPPRPAPAPERPPAEWSPEAAAAPVIRGLDRPQRIEMELEGGLRITGRLKSFKLTPIEDDGPDT